MVRKAAWLSGAILAGMVAGCAPNSPIQPGGKNGPVSPTTDRSDTSPIVATAGGAAVTRDELLQPLMRAYGLKVLLIVLQRDMAREECRLKGITLTKEDIEHERVWSIEYLTGSLPETADMAERERALEQVLAHPKEGDERTTRAEFDVLVEANAYMRKLVAETLKDSVTDEQLHQQFDRQYGSKVRVRHILVANPQDAIAVRARIDAGEDFAALARKLSLQRDTGERGGELLPFTANDSRVPANFRNIAFSMKPGDISDPVQVEGGYHLIKLEQIIQPVAVKFEDVKESLRDNVQKALIIQGVNAVRARLAQAAVKTLDIKDPVLLQELNARKEARTVSPAERLKADLDKTRNATAPTTKPASTQPTKPSKTTSTRPAGLVTPATRPAEAPATAPGASAPSGATTTPAPIEAPTTQP